MKKIIIFSLFVITLFGCGTTKKQIAAGMDPWIGENINTAIMRWGPPTKVFDLPSGGYKIYSWIYEGGSVVSAYQYGNYGYATASQSRCEFHWTVNYRGIIEKYTYKGSCRVTK